MHLFFSLISKIIPLYLVIFLGFIATKKLKAKKETIAPILIYIILPFVVFNSIVSIQLTKEFLFIPVLFFFLCSGIGLLFYFIGGKLYSDSTRNLLAFISGTANTGYFGIPVAISLFGDKVLGIMVFGILGFTIYENTLGFFLTAKGNHSTKEALTRLFRLPTIYAFIIAVIANFSGFQLCDGYTCFAKNFVGAYTILGMMLIGMGLADIKSYNFDFKFVLVTFLVKFLIWPLVVGSIVLLDNNFFHIYDKSIHNIMLLLSIVPLAANAVAFATELNAKPEKAALAVFLSTIFALFFIPIFSILFF